MNITDQVIYMLDKFGIKEISDLSGYSTATVSRVLSKKGNYSEAAEKKILQVIENHRDQIARRSVSSKMKFVGVTIPTLAGDFFSVITTKVTDKLIARGFYPILVKFGKNGLSINEVAELFREVNVLSIIVISDILSDAQIRELNVPVIFINRWFEDKNVDRSFMKYACIHPDYDASGRIAAKELIRAGCRTFGYVEGSRLAQISSQIRHKAFKEEIESRGFTCRETEILEDLSEMEAGHENTLHLLRSGKVPEGIFCATDWIAVSAIRCLGEHGYSVPEDVKVIGFGCVSEYLNMQSTLSTIDMGMDSIVTEAAFLATSAVIDPDFANKDIIMPVTFIERHSTAGVQISNRTSGR